MSIRVLVAGCSPAGIKRIADMRTLGVRDFILFDADAYSLKAASRGLERPTLLSDFTRTTALKADAAVLAASPAECVRMGALLASRGIAVLVERTGQWSADDLTGLARQNGENSAPVMVSAPWMFHPVLLHIKNLLDSEVAGRLLRVGYVESQRPAYGQGASGSAHFGAWAFPVIHWLFGARCNAGAIGILFESPGGVSWNIAMESGLQIGCEVDLSEGAARYQILIEGEKGKIRADVLAGTVETYLAELGSWYTGRLPAGIDAVAIEETRHFLECAGGGQRPVYGPGPWAESMSLALDAVASVRTAR